MRLGNGFKISLMFFAVLALLKVSEGAMKKGPYLLYNGVNTEMVVLWQLEATETCTIEWGLDTSYSIGSFVTSEYGTYHQHKHTITNLTPGTKYYYRLQDSTGWHPGSFTSAPADSATSVKFLAYGDTRSNPGTHDAVNSQMTNTYTADPAYQTFTLHSGDWVSNGDDETDWTNQFFDAARTNTRQIQANLPINGCKGNHEQSGAMYKKYWPYPYVAGFYWSFDYGPAHFAVVDQYTDYSSGSTQLNWLEDDLATTTKEWNFVIFHAPGYSAGGSHGDNIAVRNRIQPLCEQYGVDIVFSGHNHYYCHSDVNEVKHITTGGGGAPLRTPNPNYSEYVEFVAKENHFCKIDINGAQLTFYAIKKSDGSVIDSFTLTHKIRGDFKPDGHVDFADFVILASAWRSQKGDTNWNRHCDISDPNDDVIDFLDLKIFAENWLCGK